VFRFAFKIERMFGVHRNVKHAAEKTPANPFIEILEKNGKIIFLHAPETAIERIIRELAALNPDNMTPAEALTAVQRWKGVLGPLPENPE
jgi:hypothetical protein